MVFWQLGGLAQISEQLSSSDIAHEEVQVATVLGEAFESDLNVS